MKTKFLAILCLVFFHCLSGKCQNPLQTAGITKKMRVIMDNDFSGDPDGLFALSHLLLSPSVDTRGIIGSHIGVKDFIDPSEKQAENAATKAKQILQHLNLSNQVPVLTGSNKAMLNDSTPVKNEAVDFIIKEALRTDTKQPLYIVCGAGLTEVASALLTNPSIAGKFTLVWIGGLEYPGVAFAPPKSGKIEYNTNIDINAAMVVFNQSQVPIWQVPRDAYRQCIVSYPQLLLHVKNKGAIGNYLFDELMQLMKHLKNIGETYILGDSPLVLLTALQTYFEADPASCTYQKLPAPRINPQGQYVNNPAGRLIRVYTQLDTWLMFDDFFARLELNKQ